MTTPVSAFGPRLALLRQQRGLSISQLSEKAGLHCELIRKIEQGHRAHPRIDTVVKLADALGVTLDELTRG